MPKINLNSKIMVATLLLFTLTAVSQTAQAQRLQPTSLLNAKCVDSGAGGVRVEDQDVAIGRSVYTSMFHLGSGNRSASLTCKIKPNRSQQPVFQTLNLGFGMRDNDQSSPPVAVNIYVDGRQVVNQTVRPTERAELAVDVGTVSNVTIEAACSSQSQYCDRVYFYQAMLQPKTPVPMPKK